MPVSDDAHTEVLHRLDAQDRLLRAIEKHGRDTNGRIGKLEVAQAIEKDRREQASRQRGARLSRKGLWIAGLAMLGGWGTIVAVVITAAHP